MALHLQNKPLRRRPVLEPLLDDSPSSRSLESNELFTILYLSPCQIVLSNDPLDVLDFDDPIPCNITLYECFDEKNVDYDENGSMIATEVTTEFDYEVWMKLGSDPQRTLEALEGSILEHLASILGLEVCELTGSAESRGGNRRRLQEFFSAKVEDQIVAVDSLPTDIPDTSVDECTFQVPDSDSDKVECLAVKGGVTATIRGQDNEDTAIRVREGIKRVVRSGMFSDTYVSPVSPVRKAWFIGDRLNPDQPDPVQITQLTNDEQDKGMPPYGVALFVIGAAIVVALLALLLQRRRRQQRYEERGMYFVDATKGAHEEDIANASNDVFTDEQDYQTLRKPRSRGSSLGSAESSFASDMVPGGVTANSVSSRSLPPGVSTAGIAIAAAIVGAAVGTPATDSQKSQNGTKDDPIPGSLSSSDSLALKPQGSTDPSSPSDGSIEDGDDSGGLLLPADISPGAAKSSSPSKGSSSGKKKKKKKKRKSAGSPDGMSPEQVLEHLEGANEDTILNHLYNISEVDESIIGGSGDDSVAEVLKMSPGR